MPRRQSLKKNILLDFSSLLKAKINNEYGINYFNDLLLSRKNFNYIDNFTLYHEFLHFQLLKMGKVKWQGIL